MNIIWLDQNQWIKIAQALSSPQDNREICNLIEEMRRAVTNGIACFPLAFSNIYETYKINRVYQRRDLSKVQCDISKGIVFRGRQRQLSNEITSFVADIFSFQKVMQGKYWFLSNIFFESLMDFDDERLSLDLPHNLINLIHKDPEFFLFDYLNNTIEEERKKAVNNFTNRSQQLISQINSRRQSMKNESLAMNKKVYSATLLIEEYDRILRICNLAGADWKNISDIGHRVAKKMIKDVPILNVEVELAIRIELLNNRDVNENDFRDMHSFCIAVPYADCIVAENLFVNLAKQSKLDNHYDTLITTDIFKIKNYF